MALYVIIAIGIGLLIGVYFFDKAVQQKDAQRRAASGNNGALVSCPECKQLTRRGGVPAWQILCSVLLFPFGLLTLLAGRNPSVCGHCGFRWQR